MSELMIETIKKLGLSLKEHLSFVLLIIAVVLALRFVWVTYSFDLMTLLLSGFAFVGSIMNDLNQSKVKKEKTREKKW